LKEVASAVHSEVVMVGLNFDSEELVERQLEQHCDHPQAFWEEEAEGLQLLSLGWAVAEAQVLGLEAAVEEEQKICAPP
jgi:hypothetical protein